MTLHFYMTLRIWLKPKNKGERIMKSVFERIAMPVTIHLDIIKNEVRDVARDINRDWTSLDELTRYATEVTASAVVTIEGDDKWSRDEILDILQSYEYESNDEIRNQLVTFVCNNLSKLEDYPMITLLDAYTKLLLEATPPSPLCKKTGTTYIIDQNTEWSNIPLQIDTDWLGSSLIKRKFHSRYKAMFSFDFTTPEEFYFLKDTCMMLDFVSSFGNFMDIYESDIMNTYVEEYQRAKEIEDEYNDPIVNFITFIKETTEFDAILHLHKFRRDY